MWRSQLIPFYFLIKLEDTARYGGSGGGLWPSTEALFALQAKKEFNMLFWPILGDFWCPVVTLVTFTSNISNFERNPKKTKKSKKNPKNVKQFQKIQKSKKVQKIQKIQK